MVLRGLSFWALAAAVACSGSGTQPSPDGALSPADAALADAGDHPDAGGHPDGAAAHPDAAAPAPDAATPDAATPDAPSTGGLSVTGTVTGQGLASPGARVTLANGGLFDEARTDGTGAYAFADVPPGIYTVGVSAPGREYQEGTVTVGSVSA
jgi:hypothetical protein